VVHVHVARYGPYFVLGKLLDWFNCEEGNASNLSQQRLGGGKTRRARAPSAMATK